MKKCKICDKITYWDEYAGKKHECPPKWRVKLAGDDGLVASYIYDHDPEYAAMAYAQAIDGGIPGFFSGDYDKPWTVEVRPEPFDGTGARYFEVVGRVQQMTYKIKEVI